MNQPTARFDRTDLALLALLQTEGRLTNAELAERVNLSPSACLRRVQRLERDGVIAGYGALSDWVRSMRLSARRCASRIPCGRRMRDRPGIV